jgi:hypothetical protein
VVLFLHSESSATVALLLRNSHCIRLSPTTSTGSIKQHGYVSRSAILNGCCCFVSLSYFACALGDRFMLSPVC